MAGRDRFNRAEVYFMTIIEGKAIAVRHERIDEAAAGQRIDNYLMRIAKGVPKSHVYRILRSGEVRVNGGRVQQTYRLQEGDEVRIPPIRVAEPTRAAPAPVGKALPVVFEDDALLVIDKPSGKAVHGGVMTEWRWGVAAYWATCTFTRALGSSPNISGAYMASTRLGGSAKSPALFRRTVYSILTVPLGRYS